MFDIVNLPVSPISSLQIPGFLTRSRFLGTTQRRHRRRRSRPSPAAGKPCYRLDLIPMAGLPDGPLVEILSRVPVKSIFRFRCVSKAWRDLIDDPLNRRKLPQTLEGFLVIDEPVRNVDGDVGHLDFIKFLARSVPVDVDSCFSFLTKLPEIGNLFYLDSCNGLLLFEHHSKASPLDMLGYIVCNPATKHWGTVPPCGCCQTSTAQSARKILFAFHPAVSSHFHLIQFCQRFWDLGPGTFENPSISVHAYTSETGMWSHSDEQGHLEGWRHQSIHTHLCLSQRAFVNGILHFVVSDLDQTQMVAVDVRGKTKWMITVPVVAEGRCRNIFTYYIGRCQGRLHYINYDFDAHDSRNMQSYELTVWVLQNYDTQEWVLKDTVSFLRLFGRMTASFVDFDVVAIHPDCNMVFVLHRLNKLIAYDMDRKEVSVVARFENKGNIQIAPYIPYFSESPALKDKHRKRML